MKRYLTMMVVVVLALVFIATSTPANASIFTKVFDSPGVVIAAVTGAGVGFAVGAAIDDDGNVWTGKIIGTTAGIPTGIIFYKLIRKKKAPEVPQSEGPTPGKKGDGVHNVGFSPAYTH